MIITFDGTTSSGKSSIAKELSKKTDICFVSTGSLYRAITNKFLNLGITPEDDEKLKFILSTTDLEYIHEKDKNIIKVDGLLQSHNTLKSPEVSNATPLYACKDFVREYIRIIQNTYSLVIHNLLFNFVQYTQRERCIFGEKNPLILGKYLVEYIR